MGIWRRPTRDKEVVASFVLAPFITSIIERPRQRATCRLQLARYQEFRAALAGRLRGLGLHSPDLYGLLAGRLVAVCPACRTRLSAEYLEWLATVEAPPRLEATKVARFHQGRCVNPECSATEIHLYWQP